MLLLISLSLKKKCVNAHAPTYIIIYVCLNLPNNYIQYQKIVGIFQKNIHGPIQLFVDPNLVTLPNPPKKNRVFVDLFGAEENMFPVTTSGEGDKT